MMLTSQYYPDSCDIYSYATDLKGNTEVAKTLLHESISCHAYKISSMKLAMMLGINYIDTFKLLIPHTYGGNTITVGEGYKIILTKDGIIYKLRAENVTKFASHWEVEAIEDNV